MKVTNEFQIEFEKSGRLYRVSIPRGAPLVEAYGAILEIAHELLNMSRIKAGDPSQQIIEMTEEEFQKSLSPPQE